jgi:DNA recombination-dependent growth factor C
MESISVSDILEKIELLKKEEQRLTDEIKKVKSQISVLESLLPRQIQEHGKTLENIADVAELILSKHGERLYFGNLLSKVSKYMGRTIPASSLRFAMVKDKKQRFESHKRGYYHLKFPIPITSS